jgi:hypothetical protein
MFYVVFVFFWLLQPAFMLAGCSNNSNSKEVLYDEISLPLKKGYRARAAEKLESSAKSGKLQLSDIAYNYAWAGNKEKH